MDDFVLANMIVGVRPELAADLAMAVDALLERDDLDAARRARLEAFRRELGPTGERVPAPLAPPVQPELTGEIQAIRDRLHGGASRIGEDEIKALGDALRGVQNELKSISEDRARAVAEHAAAAARRQRRREPAP
jgi:hypothetical protein